MIPPVALNNSSPLTPPDSLEATAAKSVLSNTVPTTQNSKGQLPLQPRCPAQDQSPSSGTQSGNFAAILSSITRLLELLTNLLSIFKAASSSSPSSPVPSTKHIREVSSSSSPLQGGGEFLWKPQSEKDQNVAVLLPSSLNGNVKDVSVLSPDKSKTFEKGTFSGVGNGGREHYRFSSPGGDFPDGSHVVITMKNGTTRDITIKDTAARQQS